jgi:hypothetical protein
VPPPVSEHALCSPLIVETGPVPPPGLDQVSHPWLKGRARLASMVEGDGDSGARIHD